MIKFEKVSFEQFCRDFIELTGNDPQSIGIDEKAIRDIYDSIQLPKRSTSQAAGYDFYTPYYCQLQTGCDAHILTGVRAVMDSEYVLMIYPRSSLGIKYGVTLANSTGVIDADYAKAQNEGHIHIVLTAKESPIKHFITFAQGDRIAQGVFLKFFTTDDDVADGQRTGGIGSTGN